MLLTSALHFINLGIASSILSFGYYLGTRH